MAGHLAALSLLLLLRASAAGKPPCGPLPVPAGLQSDVRRAGPGGQPWSQRLFRPVDAASREALLFIAGGPGQSDGYLAQPLATLGRTLPVVFYDQAGSGRSAALPTHLARLQQQPRQPPKQQSKRQQLHAVLDAYVDELLGVARRHGLRDVHLAGHSFGATVALELLRKLDGRRLDGRLDAAGDAACADTCPDCCKSGLEKHCFGSAADPTAQALARRVCPKTCAVCGEGAGETPALPPPAAGAAGRHPPAKWRLRVLSVAFLSPSIDLPQWQLDATYADTMLRSGGAADGGSGGSGGSGGGGGGDVGARYTEDVVLRHWRLPQVQALLCKPNGALYGTLWGAAEDTPGGLLAGYNGTALLAAAAQRRPLLFAAGLHDEVPPHTLARFAAQAQAQAAAPAPAVAAAASRLRRPAPPAAPRLLSAENDVGALILPHSGHLYFGASDWWRLRVALRTLVTRASPRGGGAPRLGSAQLPPASSAARSQPAAVPAAVAAAAAGARVEAGPAVARRLRALRRRLRAAEDSPNLITRSMGYLGRLITGGAVGAGVLRQATRAEQVRWARLSQRGARRVGLDLPDEIQATLDVWYISTLSLPARAAATYRPHPVLLDSVKGGLWRWSEWTADGTRAAGKGPILSFIFAESLRRCGVRGLAPYEGWRAIARRARWVVPGIGSAAFDERGVPPAGAQLVLFAYLLTHIVIYNTEWFTRAPDPATPQGRDVASAGRELLRLAPFLLRLPPGGGATGRRSPGEEHRAFDIVGEVLICLLRLHGGAHPMVRALHARVAEYAVRGAHSSAFLLGQGGGGGGGGGKGGSGGGRETIDWHTLVVVTGGLSMVAGEHVYGEPRRHPPPWHKRGLLAEPGWAPLQRRSRAHNKL